jgi:hypothetical protein
LDTREAIKSSEWVNISSNSIEEFLSMEFLNIKEIDLVRALIRWGIFQLKKENKDDLAANLRKKILPGLRKIRFESMTQQEMAYLCKEELREVLSSEEKCSILMSIITGDWKPIPSEIMPLKLSPRNNVLTACSFSFVAGNSQLRKSCGIFSTSFTFQIDKRALIVGLKLKLPIESSLHESIIISILDDKMALIGKCSSKVMIMHKGVEICKINALHSLNANTKYHLCTTFQCGKSCYHKVYTHANTTKRISNGLTLTVSTPSIDAHVEGLVFEIQNSM